MISSQFLHSRKVVCFIYILAMFMASLDGTIVYVALPTIGEDLGVSSADLSGVTVWYLVGVAAILPIAGWLGDRFGSKKIFLSALSLFTIASIICGLVQTVGLLNIARFIQGLGGGMLAPIGMAMIFRTFSVEERPKVSRSLVLPIAIAPALGPVVGGLILEILSWQWIFFINVPIGVIAIVIGMFYLTEQQVESVGKMDWKGFVLIVIGYPLLMFSLTQGSSRGWTSIEILSSAICGLLLVSVFILHAINKEKPIMDVKLLSESTFRKVSILSFFAVGGLQSLLFIFPIMYQQAVGATALESGIVVFIEAIGLMLASRIIPISLKKLGVYRVILFGFLGACICFIIMSIVGPFANPWVLRILLFTIGLTLGHSVIAMQYTTFTNITSENMSKATTLFNVQNRLGAAIGISMIASLLIVLQDGAESIMNPIPYQISIFVAALFLAISFILTFKNRHIIKRSDKQSNRDTIKGEKAG
ncbi:DHA2 family efflux MFS transporter permease subunit [Oceanobacillus kimchii]|uniref:DHA2 family efflux MFS transporter permease subunit n=1 Tax=Oceanobacillus kimchii TaxID=746691 RepID=UPI0021A2B40F|nr:DHA2 family efflux MFS transporter permease subunit [Oceanobacillus kimchii]MCT1578468.1 DHA2 family efflux MFS transporter permease subunit [Oceanobacillus kimchii]MCT2136483.1 DHA2 family efflux MFS transporter permease subunit [Oceanobacillus kimchii]